MKLSLCHFSYRFAEQVLNSKLAIKQEVEQILTNPEINIPSLSRPNFNEILLKLFTEKGWESESPVFDEPGDPAAKMDFLKQRVGIEVGFGHSSFLGIDLLKFQVASYSGLDKIDVGIYVATTKDFQKRMGKDFNQNWGGSLTYEKIIRYLPHFKSAIQVPIYVLGIDLI
ncbi:restriction endonuclease [candidate division WOR-3 bacterium]|nr:restriction endonuclease [candidate division WOR-3 bacterium]